MLVRLDTSPGLPESWKNTTERIKDLPLIEKAKIVNDSVNAYSYIDDISHWGKEDYWLTPMEFYAQHGGDCEDFAITKYVWLRKLGVPEENLRVTVVYDAIRKVPHTILALNEGSQSLILDNQETEIRNKNQFPQYRPLFSINRYSWRLEMS